MTGDHNKVSYAGRRVALGVTGGIAAYKAIEILRGLQRAGCDVRVAMTRHACEFVQPLTFRALSGSYVLVDDYAPDNPDPIAHITFSQTVHLLLVAPATANALAKFANGVADDFLTSTYLACTAPILVAPAMNTTMWEHPSTQRNLAKLRADGVHILEPDQGEMACGTFGPGRLSEPERIVSAALALLNQKPKAGDLTGEHILITAGATREPIDPVRFISNRSSGRMGFALAQAARSRGAEVTVVAGVTSVTPPNDVRLIQTITADEMHRAVFEHLKDATAFIAAAAVSDYSPAELSSQKIKKTSDVMELKLKRTPDILRDVAKSRRNGQLVIGFAAETEEVTAHAREKLTSKNLDAIVANDVSLPEAGFDSENNAMIILFRDKPDTVDVPLMSKTEAAHRILDELVKLRGERPALSKASSKTR
ncbi:MAG TPA: bifunctional phosphopantothenoylcysteine decarboxylase/phosphopantothenate--cysteine ligase CoaBC [Pyrinomonadaceae bacterium]|nr:bifunctional phosphopantothenoylcysteine decarboxylase/phosphopantothenate--cysteine ligase CoaBC [Pyrinomonadaceae bacterium]